MNHARPLQTPGASRKRKERDYSCRTTPTAVNLSRQSKPLPKGAESPANPMQLMASNRLLAGYMAHEFLTKGTLFGEKLDPARAESWNKQVDPNQRQAASSEAEPNGKLKPHGYMEVASLLKSDGVVIPGVVNPSQLARWIDRM